MKYKFLKSFIFISLFFICKITVGQIQILDKLDNSPIPFAHLISEKGDLIATSDINGNIDLGRLSRMVDEESNIIVQHISYNNLRISYSKLKRSKSISLLVRKIALPEVKVNASHDKNMILVLKGFFRSYQLVDSVPKYYTDGIVEYYITSKNKLKNRVVEHRSFYNAQIINNEKIRVATVSMDVAGIPYIDALPIAKQIGEEYSFKKVNNMFDIEKEDSIVGRIKTENELGKVQVSVDLIAPQMDRTRKLFGYISKIPKIMITENYFSRNPLKPIKSNLESRKEYRKIYFKHKKDKVFSENDVIHEFFVINSYYISKTKLKKVKMSGSFGLLRSTSYSKEYWKRLEEHNIPALNKNIERQLNTKLIPYK